MDINVRLYGNSGGNSRQSKISAKQTSHQSRQVFSKTGSVSTVKMAKTAGGMAKGVMSGSASKVMASVPVLAAVFAALHMVDRVVNFGAGVYQAWSGEDMFATNVRAYSKTISSAGLNLLAGTIKNELYVKPRITRENYMRDYGRDLYTRVGYNNKNDLT
jgi:hypothetical protein